MQCNISNVVFVLVLISALPGCSAKLAVYDESGSELKGVPVRSPALVLITTTTTYEIDPSISSATPNYSTIQKVCQPTSSQSTSVLPIGQLSYVSYDPAPLAKSEFKVEFNDSGAAKSISVNSDPAATTEAASSLLSTVLPFLKAPKAAALDGGDLGALRKKSCIVKKTEITSVKALKVQ